MTAFVATMHQVTPNRWVFEPPDVAPMKALCDACQRSVAILRPQSTSFSSGSYEVRGTCGDCGAEVVLSLR